MTLRELQDQIREFYLKHGAEVDRPLDGAMTPTTVDVAALTLEEVSKALLRCYDQTQAPIALRSHLILEELAELMRAVSAGDRLKFVDALGDLQYVVSGTGVTYGVRDPDGILAEIHASNMTKEATGDPRVRRKGRDYRPPSLERFE